MTTIAWDGRILVADRQTTWGTTPVRGDNKIFIARHGGQAFLIGCGGITEECRAVRLWVLGLGPEPAVSNDMRIMAIDSGGNVFVGSRPGMWAPIGRRPWAIGSGGDYALGAMSAGADARRAIRIAAKLDVHTGMGTTALDLVRLQNRR